MSPHAGLLSVCVGCNDLQRWHATTNGLEASAAADNDALLCLDELAQVAPAGDIAQNAVD